MKVLFVCLGNICRSPMAQGVFQKIVDDHGLTESYEISSAGTNPFMFGHHFHKNTLAILEQNGINLEGRSRTVDYDDLVFFDHILALDTSVQTDLLDLDIKKEFVHKIQCLMEYATNPPAVLDVPDPYYGGIEGFEHSYKLISDCCKNLFEKVNK